MQSPDFLSWGTEHPEPQPRCRSRLRLTSVRCRAASPTPRQTRTIPSVMLRATPLRSALVFAMSAKSRRCSKRGSPTTSHSRYSISETSPAPARVYRMDFLYRDLLCSSAVLRSLRSSTNMFQRRGGNCGGSMSRLLDIYIPRLRDSSVLRSAV